MKRYSNGIVKLKNVVICCYSSTGPLKGGMEYLGPGFFGGLALI